MADYPFEERLKRGPYYTVVELAVEGGVPDVVNCTIRAETMVSNGDRVTIVDALFAR
jgi:hypothetical protein